MKRQEPIFLSRNIVTMNESFPRLRGKVISDYTPDISLLRASLLNDWKLHGEVEFTSGPDHTFVMQFDKLDDLLNVWRGEPWFYQDDLFLVQPDTGTSHKLQFRKAGFWVRFDNLPSEYLSTSSASALACHIGEPMEYPIKPEVGSLKVLVRIDITKPLIRSLQVVLDDGSLVVVSVNYDGRLPRYCSHCGVPGHQLESCRKRTPLKLSLKNFLGSCLPRYRSQDAQACAHSRETDRMLERTTPTGHTSNNRSQSINRQHPCDVSNDLMPNVTTSTSSGIQVSAILDSTQDEERQIDVPADQGFDPQGSMSQDYSVQLYSCYITQGPSFLQHVENSQLDSDLGAALRRMELVIVIGRLPSELRSAALRSVAVNRGVESVALADTEPTRLLVIGVGIDAAEILEYLRRRLNRAARSNTLNTRFHITLDMPSGSSANILSRMDHTKPNSSPARVQLMTVHLLDLLGSARHSP